MPTRNVVLTEHHERMIASLVESGRYQNASEVLREGLRLVEERDARQAATVKALRESAAMGWADLDTGRYVELSADEVGPHLQGLASEAIGRARKD